MPLLRETRSVCPVCLRGLTAQLVSGPDGVVTMEKRCPAHGDFSVPVWRGLVDFNAWRGHVPPLAAREGEICPAYCAKCAAHPQGSCCVLLELTRRCNLHCRFCFAGEELPEPSLAELRAAVDEILSHGKPLIQLSGGEPTMREDLPELIRYIRDSGGRWVQLNSNGLRLAEDPDYAKTLAEAGLSFVFLQFDGVDDAVYELLRGRPLLDIKRKAIENCGRAGLGVTLVPTVVRGVNDQQIGDIVRAGVSLAPVVRGIHFQPVSYFGRVPGLPAADSRYTLDELIAALGTQAGIPEENLAPSNCDHPGCGLHAAFTIGDGGDLLPLTTRRAAQDSEGEGCCCAPVSPAQNRAYIGVRWSAAPAESDAPEGSLDALLDQVGRRGFTITAMAF